MAVAWFISKFNVTVNLTADVALLPEDQWPLQFANRTDPIDASLLLLSAARYGRIELTDRVIYKVSATASILTQIAGLPGVKRIPATAMDNTLSSLTANQRQAIADELTDQGYTLADLQAVGLDNLASATLRQVLRFMARTRKLPRFNMTTFQVEAGDETVNCFPAVDDVETGVT